MTLRRVQHLLMFLSFSLLSAGIRDDGEVVMKHLKQHWKAAPSGEKKKQAGGAIDAFGRIRKSLRHDHDLTVKNEHLVRQNMQLAERVKTLESQAQTVKQTVVSHGQRNLESMRLQSQLRDMQQREKVFAQRIDDLSKQLAAVKGTSQ